MKQITEARFLKDVAAHQMTVLRDGGIYRHLKFKAAKDNWNQWFELVTWPGSLLIGGDMGTWSFSRIEDMFQFFRRPDGDLNPDYWAEKLEACSRIDGDCKTFCARTFKAAVIESLDNYSLEEAERQKIEQAIRDDVFLDEEDETVLRRELSDFKHGDFELSETWEITGRVWGYRFLWCLYAIVWGIQQYDYREDRSSSPKLSREPEAGAQG